MTRMIAWIVALAGIGGAVLAWLVVDPRTSPVTVPAGAATAGPVEVRHPFELLPADVMADRETPALAVAADGSVVLAWASQTGEAERTLCLARSGDGGTTFGTPVPWRKVPIYRFTSGGQGDPKVSFSTHVLPRLAAGRDALYLGWVEAIDGGPRVRYLVARSTDGGRSFSDPIPAHGDGASRPGFTALEVDATGTVCCAWLDGRNQGQQPFVGTWPDGSSGFSPERLVFAGPDGRGVCPCCDTAVARTPDGATFVAFRDSDGGYRDIVVARSGGGAEDFAPPVPVSPDHWPFDGCPHDGPSLALTGGLLHVAWMDAHTGRGRVWIASTLLSALTFEPREVSPSTRGAQGHPRLLAAGAGVLHIVWDEGLDAAEPAPASSHAGHGHDHGAPPSGSGRAVLYARSAADGTSFSPALPLAPRPGAFQMHPALAAGPDGAVYVAWSELDEEGKRVVFVRLRTPKKAP